MINKTGTIVGIKSGAWSLWHAGHTWCIQECKKYCTYLIILANDDNYILNKKGICPINLEDRLYIISNIKGVDEVGYFSEQTEHNWIKDFKEKRFHKEFKNAKLIVFHSDELKDWPKENLPGYGLSDEIIFIDKINRSESVTKIFSEIRKQK